MANDSGSVKLAVSEETEARARIPLSSRVEVDLAALSHPGVRKDNEDHFIAGRFDRTMRTLVSN
ncbi:MAG: hypothetical protein ACM3NW_03855, partial [Syntrophomonadaceae bacterium]